MRSYFLFLFLLLTGASFAQSYNSKRITKLFEKPIEKSYYVKERFHNGKLYVEGLAVQKIYSKKNRIELKRGACKWYYRTGQLKDSIFYNDMGLPTGTALRYRKNGTISEKIDYGTSSNFKVKERNWLVAIPQDYSITTYLEKPNVPQKREVFKARKKDGVFQYFDLNGNVIEERKFSKGKRLKNK